MQTKYLKMSMYALLISALTFACGDDEEDEKEPEVITAVIELSSPADAATFDMQTVEAITFEWKKDANLSDYQLLVSATQDLANPVVSITGDQASYEWAGSTIEAVLIELGVDYLGSQVFYWSVKPTSLTIETETSVRSFTVTRKNHPPKYGEWLFDDANSPGKALVGEDITIHWTDRSLASENAGTSLAKHEVIAGCEGPKAGDYSLELQNQAWIKVPHGIKPAGSDKYINVYTMLMDVNIINDGSNRVQAPLVTTFLHNYFTAEESDQTWKTQPDDRIASSGWYAGHPHNIALIMESVGITPNDANHQGQISAVQTLWRSDTDTIPESECTHFITDTWYRLVWRVDLVNQWMDIWVNGKHLAYDRSNPTVLIKDACRWALEKDGFIMFAPYNVRSRRIARLAVWDYFISNEEVLSLGVAGDPTDVGNE